MVHLGPSRGCAACRLRKKKCDLENPCSQCKRRGLECSGPREFDRSHFRDETSKMKTKHANSTASSAPFSSERSNALSSGWVSTTSSDYPTPVDSHSGSQSPSVWSTGEGSSHLVPYTRAATPAPVAIAIPARTLAEGFFFHAITSCNSSLPVSGFGPFTQFSKLLPSLYFKAKTDSPLRLSTGALAMACFGLLPDCRKYGALSAPAYGKALAGTSLALNDGNDSKSDETLMTILTLSVYEVLRPKTGSSYVQSCRNHMDAAVKLLQHRGVDQFQDPTSLSLFRAMRLHMVQTYAHGKKPLPAFCDEHEWSSDYDDGTEPMDMLVRSVLDLPRLRADAEYIASLPFGHQRRTLQDNLMHEALRLDDKLERWYNDLPFDSQPTIWEHDATDTTPHASASWQPPTLHTYKDLFNAFTLNTYRVYRIYVHQVLLQCAWFLDLPSSVQLSASMLQQMIDDICCSIEYHLASSHLATDIGAFYLIGPLTAACRTLKTSDPAASGCVYTMDGGSLTVAYAIPPAQKHYIDTKLTKIAFPDKPRQGPALIMDASAAARMFKLQETAAAAAPKA